MDEKIFETNQGVVKTSNSILSFSDCPNKCIDGYYIDPYKHKRVKCTYCENKRKQLAQSKVQLEGDKSIQTLLNIPNMLSGYGSLQFATIVPVDSQYFSFNEPINYMQSLFEKASSGDCSEESLLFNLGKVSCVRNFINPYLMRAYIGGATVSPYITARDVFNLVRKETGLIVTDDGVVTDYIDDYIVSNLKYNDLLTSDICVVHITTGSLYTQVRAVKGLMQMRANNNKSTIIFTDAWYTKFEHELRDSLQMLYTLENPLDKSVARLVKFERIKEEDIDDSEFDIKKVKGKESSALSGKQQISGATAQQFTNLFSSKNNL